MHLIHYPCAQNLTTLALAAPEISLGARKSKMGHATLTTFLLKVIRLPYVDTCTQFDHSSFSRSRDMVGAQQNLNGLAYVT